MADILEITNENFNEKVISAAKPVLVDFYATWCGPCKMLNPIIEAVNGEVGGSVIIAKCDIDKSMEIAQEYGIMNVPTLLMFRDGAEVDRAIGFRNKTQILEMIKNQIN